MAKTDKSSKAKPSSAAASTGKGMRPIALFLISAVVAAAVVGGVIYYRGSDQPDPDAGKKDPNLLELMQAGPLEEMSLGKADAPNTIIEYASMTCPHCAQFEKTVFPELKAKYIDTGKARFIFREFPLDGLAARASMLARCAGPDRYFPMIDGLFQTQTNWAVPGEEAAERLLMIARQAGFSKERFDQCMADKDLFAKIVEGRQLAHDKFGVDSTPTFFINGKRLTGEQQLKDFEAVLEGKTEGTPPPSG